MSSPRSGTVAPPPRRTSCGSAASWRRCRRADPTGARPAPHRISLDFVLRGDCPLWDHLVGMGGLLATPPDATGYPACPPLADGVLHDASIEALADPSRRRGCRCRGGRTPELSVSSDLADRRFVAAGTRAYSIGFEDGRFYANGWHITGELGGVWTPPLKLVDGVWFGLDGQWVGPATKFSSGWGYSRVTRLSQVSSAPGAICSGTIQARWLPAAGWRRRRGLALVLGDDEVLVPHFVFVYSELQHPLEDHASTAIVATVEP